MDAPPIIRPRPKAVSRTNLPPKDIVFRLAVLAVLSIELFWYPVYYFTTYESGPDGNMTKPPNSMLHTTRHPLPPWFIRVRQEGSGRCPGSQKFVSTIGR